MKSPLSIRLFALVALLCCFSLFACKKTKKPGSRKQPNARRQAPKAAGTITVYSGRSKRLVQPLVKMFTKETGIQVKVKYGKTTQLALLLQEEMKGKNSPADVFWSQDAGALGLLANAGHFQTLPASLTKAVPAIFRDEKGRWVATSGRARVLAYAPQKVAADKLPKTLQELTQPKWKGRVGWAPTNGSFQAFVTAMRAAEGEAKTEAWLKAMKANGAKSYPKNTAIVKAIAAGEVDLGLPNHYYLLRFKAKDAKYPVEQTFFPGRHIGNLVNVAGTGILSSSKNVKGAQRFIQFLLSKNAQQYITSTIFEYPVAAVDKPNARLLSQKKLLERTPKLPLGNIDDLKGTLKMLSRVGLP